MMMVLFEKMMVFVFDWVMSISKMFDVGRLRKFARNRLRKSKVVR